MHGWMHIRTHWCLNGYFSISRLLQTSGPQNTFSAVEFNYPLQLLYLLPSISLLLFLYEFFFFHHLLFAASPLSPSLLSLSPLPASLSSLSSHSLCLLVFNALLSLSFSAPLHTIFNSIWPVVSYRFTDTQLITETSALTCVPLKENKELNILKLTWGMRCLTRR